MKVAEVSNRYLESMLVQTRTLNDWMPSSRVTEIAFSKDVDQPPMSATSILRHPACRVRQFRLPNGDPIRAVHFVGICGSGMRALAELAHGLGWSVSGSDAGGASAALHSMRQRGWQVNAEHSQDAIPDDCDVVVYSAAVPKTNPERLHAEQSGVSCLSYSEMLGLMMGSCTGVVVAGTHGKSTTTALTATALQYAGLSPTTVFGAEVLRDAHCSLPGRSGWAGHGDLFVTEGCEYQRNFLDLRPQYAVITGIEADHLDYYRDEDDIHDAYRAFAQGVAPDGILLINQECRASREIAESAKCETATFSRQSGADWWAADIKPHGDGYRFRVFHDGWYFAEITMGLPGLHNVDNALAAIAVAHHAGASVSDIREGLADFAGLRRRFESQGSWKGVTLIDDYAHHPTAVKATLKTARKRFGQRRVICVFEPHQMCRTKALMSDFSRAFADADETLIAPIFTARESNTESAEGVALALADEITQNSCPAEYVGSLDRIIGTLDDNLRPGDVLITMGAGNIDRIHHELTRTLQRHYAAG